MTLAERIVALHRAFDEHRVPHAFGGAIAVAYWTLDPRGTSDIDVNLFVPADRAAEGLAALPQGVGVEPQTATVVARDGQVRVFWDDTPLDLFFDYAPVHGDAARGVRHVPFSGAEIPILGPVELAVFKAMFDRTRDWADLEAMAGAGTLDVDAAGRTLAGMVGRHDPRLERLALAAQRGSAG